MRTTSVRWGVVLSLAWAAVPVVAAAQDRGAGQVERPAGTERPAEPAQPAAVERPGQGERAAPPGRGHPANRREVVGAMRDAEVRHRERLAMIARLRALATAKGQTERLAALDALETKETARYERHVDTQRDTLGEDGHRKVKERLARGRDPHRKAGVAAPVERKNAPAPAPVERPAANEKPRAEEKAREPERAKEKEKEKDKPVERAKETPKAKEPARDAKPDRGAGQGQQGGGRGRLYSTGGGL